MNNSEKLSLFRKGNSGSTGLTDVPANKFDTEIIGVGLGDGGNNRWVYDYTGLVNVNQFTHKGQTAIYGHFHYSDGHDGPTVIIGYDKDLI